MLLLKGGCEAFFDASSLQVLFRSSDLVESLNVKEWLLKYFTHLTSNRGQSLTTQYLTPPVKYAAIAGYDPAEAQRSYDKCMADWATLLDAESKLVRGTPQPGLEKAHWRLNALTRSAPWMGPGCVIHEACHHKKTCLFFVDWGS